MPNQRVKEMMGYSTEGGNLVARKFLKNQALAESFWILLPHFLTSKQFGESLKEIILDLLENGSILDLFFHNIPKIQCKFKLLHLCSAFQRTKNTKIVVVQFTLSIYCLYQYCILRRNKARTDLDYTPYYCL